MKSARNMFFFAIVLLLTSCITHDTGLKTLKKSEGDYQSYILDMHSNSVSFYSFLESSGKIKGIADVVNQFKEKGDGELLFATNGGMFHSNFHPVGLLIQDGLMISQINLSKGNGNFFLQPNGVFLVDENMHPYIITTNAYTSTKKPFKFATQSGPMLVVNEKINPIFRTNSNNRYIRSGVGVTRDSKIVFLLSLTPVTFHELAKVFLDDLKCVDALYLDGAISEFYTRDNTKTSNQFGVIIAVTKK